MGASAIAAAIFPADKAFKYGIPGSLTASSAEYPMELPALTCEVDTVNGGIPDIQNPCNITLCSGTTDDLLNPSSSGGADSTKLGYQDIDGHQDN